MSATRNRRLHLVALEARDVPCTLPVVSLLAPEAPAVEGGDPAAFTVTRSGGDLSSPLVVRYHSTGDGTAGPADFNPLSGEVIIPAGQRTATILLQPVDDALVEGTEWLGLELCALPSYIADPTSYIAHAEIGDNDPPARAANVLPVLLVIANQDFYYREYAETRAELEAAGIPVVVGAQAVAASYPHPNTGQGAGDGMVLPDIALTDATADDYSAIVFVGGWGASAYQYAFEGTYYNASYNGLVETEAAANRLITEFVAQDKYVAGLCHGVSVLAWARVDGVSPLAGKTVAAYALWSPAFEAADGSAATAQQQTTRWHVEANGATMVATGSVGNPWTAADDVIVDGRIITGENYDSAAAFGRTIAAVLNG